MLLFKSFLAWLAILCLAVANGVFREEVLIPSLGQGGGLILSGMLLCVFVALVAYAFVSLSHGIAVSQSLVIGILWLCCTLAFEFGFGHYVEGKSWTDLLEAYTFKDGNVWPVVLLVTLVAPYLAALLYTRSRHVKSGNP